MPELEQVKPLALLTELVEQLGELYSAETQQLEALRAELYKVRADVTALANRIEGVFRVLDSRTEHLV